MYSKILVKQIPACPVDSLSSPTSTTSIIPQPSSLLPNVVYMSPANKENVSFSKIANASNIPVRTPSKDARTASNAVITPKLRRGHMFSKSSSDISSSSASQKTVKSNQPGYMAATTASKFRETGMEQQSTFVEPLAPAASSAGQPNRFVINPFK